MGSWASKLLKSTADAALSMTGSLLSGLAATLPATVDDTADGSLNNVTADHKWNSYNDYDAVDLDDPISQTGEAASSGHDTRKPWDPRIYAIDALYCGSNDDMAMVVPFSTESVATAFSDLVYVGPKTIVQEIQKRLNNSSTSAGTYTSAGATAYISVKTANQSGEEAESNSERHLYSYVRNSKDPDYAKDPDLMGMQSLMNPYSITRLAGAIREAPEGDSLVFSSGRANMLFDIRDSRRFYDFTKQGSSGSGEDETADRLAVLDPTTTNIIKYSNNDPWGRTPYSFQDFVFSKWWSIIPNNRLITLRKYAAPCIDNLNFDGMMEEAPDAKEKAKESFAPVSTVVTYFGGESGNSLSDLLKFTTGVNWEQISSDIWNVEGEAGSNQDQLMDEMLQKGEIFESSDAFNDQGNIDWLDTFMKGAGGFSRGMLQLGKLGSLIKGGYSADAEGEIVDKVTNAMQDPYNNGPYANKIQGPVNVINSVYKRKQGIKFEQSFKVKCDYVARPIGGVNTKAAMLDILSNCLMMGSANAMFWGGGHRFNIKPNSYPWKLDSKTESFLQKLHDGNVFGKEGAISAIHEGIKEFGSDADGNWGWDVAMNKMKDFFGTALGALQSILNSANSFFGNVFKDGINLTSKENESKGSETINNVAHHFEETIRSRVMMKTTYPTITQFRSLLTGEPVGNWHLMIGNPLNPIIVCGNLICDNMEVSFSDELGPDDFPVEMHVTYDLKHGMPRDSAAIQSMFNRGEGKIYNLPDYISATTSDFETKVDAFTGLSFPMPAQGMIGNTEAMAMQKAAGTNISTTYGSYTISKPTELQVIGNANSTLVTKFSPYYSNAVAKSLTGTKDSTLITQQGLTPVYKGNLMARKMLR